MTTPILGLTEWEASQAQPQVPVNAAVRALEVLGQTVVLSIVAEPPESSPGPDEGDVYLVDVDATGDFADHDNEIAYYSGGWQFLPARQGWLAYVLDEDTRYSYESGGWQEFVSGGSGGTSVVSSVSDASYSVLAVDNTKYIRLTNSGTKTINVQPEATEALPANGEWHFRNVGAGDATIAPGSGVTVAAPAGGSLVIPQHGTVTLKRVAEDAFELFGVTVVP